VITPPYFRSVVSVSPVEHVSVILGSCEMFFIYAIVHNQHQRVSTGCVRRAVIAMDSVLVFLTGRVSVDLNADIQSTDAVATELVRAPGSAFVDRAVGPCLVDLCILCTFAEVLHSHLQ
jgi:hypothetical protein